MEPPPPGIPEAPRPRRKPYGPGRCSECLGALETYKSEGPDGSEVTIARCSDCRATFVLGRKPTLRVEGSNAQEVSDVMQQLSPQVTAQHEAARLRSPWFSGFFYIVVLAIVVGLLLVVASVLPAWVVPIVIVGAVLLVALVGALQMRQDDRLSEKGFLQLMADVFRRLPLLLPRKQDKHGPEAGQAPEEELFASRSRVLLLARALGIFAWYVKREIERVTKQKDESNG